MNGEDRTRPRWTTRTLHHVATLAEPLIPAAQHDHLRRIFSVVAGRGGEPEEEDAGPALGFLDAWERRDPASIRELGRRHAQAWGTSYAALVEQYQHTPQRLLRLYYEDAHPGLFPGPTRITTDPSPFGALVQVSDGLPSSFHQGLIRGLVELCDARANVRVKGPGAFRTEWTRRKHQGWSARLRPALGVLRPAYLAATLVPLFVSLAVAAHDGPVAPALAILTGVGVLCFQFATNAINDYYDQLSGVDEPFGVSDARPSLSLAHLRAVAYGLYAVGASIGLFLVAQRGIEILWLGLAGFLLGFLYTAPPVRLAHRGLGELAVAVGFGPLIVLGTYFVQHGRWSPEAFLASLPLAFLIAAVLYINAFPDKQGDARVGKRTLIVRLPERPALIVYFALIALTYVVIVGGVALNGVRGLEAYAFPEWSLLGLLTLPLALYASVGLARNYRFPYRLVPANRATIVLHLATGLLFGTGYVLAMIA